MLVVVSAALLVLGGAARGEQMDVRLAGGGALEAGLVEVWRDGAWGLLCAGGQGWDLPAGHLVCQQLGFAGAIKVVRGAGPVARAAAGSRVSSSGLSCSGAAALSGCSLARAAACDRDRDAAAVVCRPESRSACGQGATAFLGSCYKVSSGQDTFVGAQQQCGRMKPGANLVEITSAVENRLVGRLLEVAGLPAASYWTGGVVNRVLDTEVKFWHGSQKQIEYDGELDVSGADQIPKGIAVQKDPKAVMPPWITQNFDQRSSYICEFPPEDIGCLAAEDPQGEKYSGTANHDKNGLACLAWDQTDGDQPWSHNYCRNPDDDMQPYCYTQKDEYSYCSIPSCSASTAQPPSAQPSICKSSPTSPGPTCFKEEFACLSGRCIAQQHVCDGDHDCDGGEDERECRRFGSLFTREEGYRLQGVTATTEEETTVATEEECAKMCYYSKQCCNSFSTRPGKDGKKDLCLLSTVFENQVFDTLVQKGSWNYHKLNVTDAPNGKCRKRRKPARNQIAGLRLTNMRKGNLGRVVEVNVKGTWGRLCDDSFSVAEANVVCKQMGFHLGAKEVIKGAGEQARETRQVLGSLQCGGEEKSLADCSMDERRTCGVEQAAGVTCREVEDGACEEDSFQCGSGECVGIGTLCDGTPTCSDRSDEDSSRCNLRIQVRLGGREHYGADSGVLEVRHKGVWGTVCRDNFGAGEAAVFCHMLDYDGDATWGEVDRVRQREGSWPIWIALREPGKCRGTEGSIEECHEAGLWEHDYACEHREDVVLTCQDSRVERDAQPAQDLLTDRNSIQIVEQCGLWRPLPTASPGRLEVPRIAGGVKVAHGTLPWQASIRLHGPGNTTFHHCGAVVVSPFHLLTTAHCIWDYRDTAGIYYVRVGDNVIEVPDAEEQEFDIESIDVHEEFGVGPYLNNDIAVIHIKKQGGQGIRFGDKVSPACLPPKDLVLTSAVNVTVSGWGKNGYDTAPRQSATNFVSKLNMVEVPVIPRPTCREEHVYGPEKISLGMFCAGLLEGGPDTCQGDSGGPAVTFVRLAKFHEIRATLVGLTSWGYGCGRENKPGVYTQVSRYVDWVYEKTRGDL